MHLFERKLEKSVLQGFVVGQGINRRFEAIVDVEAGFILDLRTDRCERDGHCSLFSIL